MSNKALDKALKSLGQVLVNARKKNGFSQAEIANAIGLTSAQFISNCERGLCKPSAKYSKFMIEYCKISKADLIDLILLVEKMKLVYDISEARVRMARGK